MRIFFFIGRWRLALDLFGRVFVDDVGLESGSVISELGGFPVKEAKFRREMERLRNSRTQDLTIAKVERERGKLIAQAFKEMNAHYNNYQRRATSAQPALVVTRVKVTFLNEPGEGSGVARSFYTSLAEALLANAPLPNLESAQVTITNLVEHRKSFQSLSLLSLNPLALGLDSISFSPKKTFSLGRAHILRASVTTTIPKPARLSPSLPSSSCTRLRRTRAARERRNGCTSPEIDKGEKRDIVALADEVRPAFDLSALFAGRRKQLGRKGHAVQPDSTLARRAKGRRTLDLGRQAIASFAGSCCGGRTQNGAYEQREPFAVCCCGRRRARPQRGRATLWRRRGRPERSLERATATAGRAALPSCAGLAAVAGRQGNGHAAGALAGSDTSPAGLRGGSASARGRVRGIGAGSERRSRRLFSSKLISENALRH